MTCEHENMNQNKQNRKILFVELRPIMACYWYVWKALFLNFATVIKPRARLTCMERKRAICVYCFIFS